MSDKNEKLEPLKPDDIIPGDASTTLWRLCAKNSWAFVPDFAGGEPFVDLACVGYLLGIAKKTVQNDYVKDVPKYGNGLVKLSEVMQRRTTNDN